MHSKTFLVVMVVMVVVTDGGKGPTEDRGLASIKAFCKGRGRLDDFRDIVQEVYLLRSGRSSTVSY